MNDGDGVNDRDSANEGDGRCRMRGRVAWHG